MASNSFGNVLKITTFGESHGKAVGVVIDGFPSKIRVEEAWIQQELERRRPGKTPWTSPRKEPDHMEILSGVFQGETTGAPIAVLIYNQDTHPSSYSPIQHLYRPGHANYTYLHKYGVFDYRGGGRASARETVCRVVAGAFAKLLLREYQIQVGAFLKKVGAEEASSPSSLEQITFLLSRSLLFCPDSEAEPKMIALLEKMKQEKDSIGGEVEFQVENLPIGLGDPIYEKLEANLAKALMSLPASKGFEIGEGARGCMQRGSEQNDAFILQEGVPTLATNHAGGLLGGISTGLPLVGRVFFKPTASIGKKQKSVDFLQNRETEFCYPLSSRHDPCVAIRAVPVVEAMVALVVADSLLMNRLAKA